ncbi:hypothetical protein NUU61_010113 [Penicillium alfredii]|uniref:Uncharacterized protein n=1 Tax=Penicillium alfredii TaxID=1506179 RepID=A0A9W9EHG3_9EURO|nr:uncharacterized protein NUU61_010113 [Penicillium alfredii]KAJ5081849.1 hypothetical protein NUU61_010113 [Penicillium alfredii]
MGRSSPPFLYDRPSTYSFYGPTDRGFNPKAATQASWIREQPKPKQRGPLVNVNRHPDSWGSFDQSKWTPITPMSPKIKDWVKYARSTQFGLRIVTLLSALASLFCSIVIQGVASTVIWIIRAGPIVAVLHTIYGIYHLSRSAVTRPPASQAGYGLFASTLDAGLIPFYVFTTFMAHGQYATDAYHWGTLFNNSNVTVQVAKATFICAIVNAGLHLVSFSLSIFLAVIFRRISHMPPDMNPLEDNLTARPLRNRRRIEAHEKNLSGSTLNSHLEDPLMEQPRMVPFMHTRGQSMEGDSNHGSVDINEKRQSQASFQPHRLSHMEPPSPEMLFHQPASQPYDLTSQVPASGIGNVAMRSPEVIDPSTHTHHLTSRVADRSDSVSPLSDNWIAYSDRSPSPVSDVHNEDDVHNGDTPDIRQSSSVYSRRTNVTATSTGSGIRDWFAYGTKPAPSIGSVIQEDTRGEYASLDTHEYYANEDNEREQDLGDRRLNIFPDPEEHDDTDDKPADSLPFNPLMLNPPTPQPVLTEKPENTDPVRRIALSDNPNLSQNQKAYVSVPHDSSDSSPTRTRFYGDLEVDGKPSLDTSRQVSDQGKNNHKPSKLSKKHSKKISAYQSLKKYDSDGEDAHLSPRIPSSPAMAEGDRKGRVVSNSGADTPRSGLGAGVGASLSSYGSYIAGLGVGRRRDVSGKVAEEGRGGNAVEERPSQPQTQTQSPSSSPTRAAGWARFAGL